MPSAVEGHKGVPECPCQVTPSSPGGIRPQRGSRRSCYLVSRRNVPCGGACTGGNLQEACSSLFSTAVRGTVLSWESAWASALLPQPRHREPLLCPHRWLDPGAGAAQRHRGLPCCSVGILEDLQSPRPCSLQSSTLPRAEKLRPAEVRE